MGHVLEAISKNLEGKPLARTSRFKITWDPYPQNNPGREPHLTQDYLWPVRELCEAQLAKTIN